MIGMYVDFRIWLVGLWTHLLCTEYRIFSALFPHKHYNKTRRIVLWKINLVQCKKDFYDELYRYILCIKYSLDKRIYLACMNFLFSATGPDYRHPFCFSSRLSWVDEKMMILLTLLVHSTHLTWLSWEKGNQET